MTNTNKIDFTKPLQTRSGKRVRLISTDFELDNLDIYSVVAEVEGEGYITYTKTGKQYTYNSSEDDLQNISEETFEQKVERFKKSDYYVSDKNYNEGHEILTWSQEYGFSVETNFEEAMESVYFE
jgi:DNA topoisomerase IA